MNAPIAPERMPLLEPDDDESTVKTARPSWAVETDKPPPPTDGGSQ